jgi:hypothetical protein
MISDDQEKPIRFYFKKGWLPEIEVDAYLIEAAGVPAILEQLDTVIQLRSELEASFFTTHPEALSDLIHAKQLDTPHQIQAELGII